MDQPTWFDDNQRDGSAVAIVMDDIAVTVEPSGLMTIDGPAGGSTTFDFDDAVVLVAVLTEGVQILRGRGHLERGEVLAWLADHAR